MLGPGPSCRLPAQVDLALGAEAKGCGDPRYPRMGGLATTRPVLQYTDQRRGRAQAPRFCSSEGRKMGKRRTQVLPFLHLFPGFGDGMQGLTQARPAPHPEPPHL